MRKVRQKPGKEESLIILRVECLEPIEKQQRLIALLLPHRTFIPTSMSSSTLPAPSQQANKAALTAALSENPLTNTHPPSGNPDIEPGEIQEIDMQAQAEGIRTVFSDPTNFNVKVRLSHRATCSTNASSKSAPTLLCLDALVRFPRNKGSQPPPNTHLLFSSDTHASDSQCSSSTRLDGGH